MTNVLFKTPREEKEFSLMPRSLKIIADRFILLSNGMGITPVITRILSPVLGESGVHRDFRALDFRDEMGVGGPRLYTSSQVSTIVSEIEKAFPRRDGKATIIHHAFINHADTNSNRAPYHFHCQISAFAKFTTPDWWTVSQAPK